MRVYSPIVFGFIKIMLLFRKKGRMIELRDILEEAKL